MAGEPVCCTCLRPYGANPIPYTGGSFIDENDVSIYVTICQECLRFLNEVRWRAVPHPGAGILLLDKLFGYSQCERHPNTYVREAAEQLWRLMLLESINTAKEKAIDAKLENFIKDHQDA